MNDEFRELMKESSKRCISSKEAADIFVSIGPKPIDLSLPQISLEDEIAIKFREFIRSFDDKKGIQIDPEKIAIFVANYLYKNNIKVSDIQYFTSEIPLFDITKENR